MFAVIYTFHVKKGVEKAFIKSWTAMTKLIIKRKGSNGSRLHFTAPGIYMAYALWKDKETWEKFEDSPPASSKKHSEIMKDSCSRIKTSHTMDVIEDLLISIDEK